MEPAGTPTIPDPPATPATYEPAPASGYEPAPTSYGWPPHPGHDEPQYEYEPPKRQSWIKRKLYPIGAAIVAFLAKIKTIILLAPKVKILATAGTMVVSVIAYETLWGFPFAVGFVILLLVHEMGHVIALRREGIKASAPMFIPFLGAVISARSLGDNAAAEARVGLAGPLLGTLGAAVCIAIWHATGNTFWQALGFTGFFLNLFNLLPVVPLDGGRAMAAMAPWMWFLGFLGMCVLAFVFPNPIILIIIVFAGLETYKRWQQRRSGSLQQLAYYAVKPRDRWLIAAVYLSLVAVLVIGMDATHLTRTLG